MTLDEYFEVGQVVTLGTHHFDADSIKAFARRFDPQPFHVDERAARNSVFGALCASGWHTASAWMKANLSKRRDPASWTGQGAAPEFGPSPGFTDLR